MPPAPHLPPTEQCPTVVDKDPQAEEAVVQDPVVCLQAEAVNRWVLDQGLAKHLNARLWEPT